MTFYNVRIVVMDWYKRQYSLVKYLSTLLSELLGVHIRGCADMMIRLCIQHIDTATYEVRAVIGTAALVKAEERGRVDFQQKGALCEVSIHTTDSFSYMSRFAKEAVCVCAESRPFFTNIYSMLSMARVQIFHIDTLSIKSFVRVPPPSSDTFIYMT